jgi:hypothetical protein
MQVQDQKLFVMDKAAYGDKYADHYLEIYKLYVEMADRVSARRQTANSFYLTVCSAIAALVGFFPQSFLGWKSALVVGAAGIAMSWMWIRNIQTYKDLNGGKFLVINALEQRLPVSPYEAEWDVLQRGRAKSTYRPFHKVEILVPYMFGILFLIVLLAGFDWTSVKEGMTVLFCGGDK